MSILVVGSIAYDTIETPSGKKDDALGGSTLYFSAAASLFTDVNVVGVIGSDFEKSELDFLKKRNVDFKGLYVEEGKTFRWGGRYHKNMNQRDTLFTNLNVFETFEPKIPEQYKNSKFIFLANIDPELQLHVLDQVNNPELVVLDTMNLWIDIRRDALEQVVRKSDIVIINDEELMQFSEEDNFVKAAKKIVEMGPSKLVIKRGEYGALLYSDDTFFFAPAYPLENVVDPTGAGDTFAGGFLGYLATQKTADENTLRSALVYGCTTASFTVEDFSLDCLRNIAREEIENRFLLFKEMMVF